MIDSPASAASIEARAMCGGVIGRWSDIVGVWTPPVGAHVMMIGLAMWSKPHLLNLSRQSAVEYPQLPAGVPRLIGSKPIHQVRDIIRCAIAARRMYAS